MGLFGRKKKAAEEEQVRPPAEKYDRSVYVQTSSQSKTADEKVKKGDGRNMAEKKAEPKKTAAKKETEKKPAAKTAEKKTAAKPAEKKTAAKTAEKKPAAKPAEKKTAVKKEAAPKEKKVWHITKREDENKWAVKLEGGSKATKLFNTKKEAEEYVKSLSANNEGSRVVSHKKDGKFQKK